MNVAYKTLESLSFQTPTQHISLHWMKVSLYLNQCKFAKLVGMIEYSLETWRERNASDVCFLSNLHHDCIERVIAKTEEKTHSMNLIDFSNYCECKYLRV